MYIFLPPPTSLIKAANSGSFHWALSWLIYFRSMSAIWSSCCRCMIWIKKYRSLAFSRFRSFALYTGSSLRAPAHLLEPQPEVATVRVAAVQDGSQWRPRHSRFTRAHPLAPELISAIYVILKYDSRQVECFFK